MGKWDIPARREITDTELRFNPYHDPQNGRFTTAGGGGGGGYLYSKGGKSAYVFEKNSGQSFDDFDDDEYENWRKRRLPKDFESGIIGEGVGYKNGRPEVKNDKGDDYFTGAAPLIPSRGGYVPISVGYTPPQKLPEIEAVSEKQRKYAEDLRNNYIDMRTAYFYNGLSDVYVKTNGDSRKIEAELHKAGYKNLNDLKNSYIENDTVKYLMTEKSARNIIDRVKNSR